MKHVAAALAVLFALPAQGSLVVSNKPTANMDCISTPGECVATDANATMNAGEIADRLAASDLHLKTYALTVQDVEVNAPASWASGHKLTITSNGAIYLASRITVQGTAALDLDVAGGPIYRKKGAIGFWDTASTLTIDGRNYTLVSSIAGMAAAIAAHPKRFYALANDYNAKGDGQVRHPPIPTPFAGTFDGLGNVISNFSIWNVESGNTALFVETKPKGVIRNLGMKDANILAEDGFNNIAGALVAYNAGTVLNCYVDGGTIRTDWLGTLGGLVGLTYGTVESSWSNVSVEGAVGAEVGGLIGNAHGQVRDVYALGRVIAGDRSDVGGLIGYNIGHLRNGYSIGHVSGGQDARVGGLLGSNFFPVRDTYWDFVGSGTQFGVGGNINIDGVTGTTADALKAALPKGFSPFVWGLNAKVNDGLPHLLTAVER